MLLLLLANNPASYAFNLSLFFSYISLVSCFSLLKSRHRRKKKSNVFVAAREFYDLNSFTFRFRGINLEISGNCLGMISLQSLREFAARLKHTRVLISHLII